LLDERRCRFVGSGSFARRAGLQRHRITIKTFNYDDVGGSDDNDKSCCSLDGINDARMVAAKLDFPHYVLDFSEAFGAQVIDNFVEEYMHGRTPNPCVICNRKIKWEEMIRKSLKLGADYIATGHYAWCEKMSRPAVMLSLAAKTAQKDQSSRLVGIDARFLASHDFPSCRIDEARIARDRRAFWFADGGKRGEL